MQFLILIIFSYLLGAVPFGALIAKAHGKDLRTIGSGNIGATNVARALGKKWAYLCFALDVLKGLLPMLAAPQLDMVDTQSGPGILSLWLMVGCAAVLGHIFPIYLKFKGGKGVATSLGMVLGLWPYYTLCGVGAFAVWVVYICVWKYVSLASIFAAVSFPLFLLFCILFIDTWDFEQLWPLLLVSFLMAFLVVVRHTENIIRIRSGTETKIMQSQKS
jgi:glycerol-3-phosphate acyltransferase PlsY